MATEAQVSANRSNAQKSTGPRTPEGKAAVAQNAVKHGFLAQEVVIKGEDAEEFEFYREGMLAELAPAGFVETMLAERIVSLSWRLRRAERLQVAAFDKVQKKDEPLPTLKPEDASWLLNQIAERGIVFSHPERERPAFGRRAVQDFNQERVLDRLLMYERRIEHSLYRTMAELRNLRKEGTGEGGKVRGSEGETVLPSFVPTFSPSSVPSSPDGVTTNATDAQEPSCETKPICPGPGETCETKPIGEGVSSLKCEVSSEQGPAASPPGLATSNVTLETAAEPPCETKPISARRIKDGEGYIPIFRRRR